VLERRHRPGIDVDVRIELLECDGEATRFEQRAGQRPFRLLEHPRFRAAYDFLVLRSESGELQGDLAGLADWWTKFQDVDSAERERMLKPDEAPKKRRRSRSRGRKREPAPDEAAAGAAAEGEESA
jgi:poly(A) polymerase